MKRGALIKSWLILVLISWTSGLYGAPPDRIRKAVNTNDTTVVPGHLRRLAQAQLDQGSVDPATPLRDMLLVTKLTPDQEADLDKLIRDQQNPASPEFGKWLAPEEFGERFGLSASDQSKLEAWLTSQGLQVDYRARGANWIRFNEHKLASFPDW